MRASLLLQESAIPFDTACMKVLEMEEALQKLIDLKAYKDEYGKDEYYLEEQPKAWALARDSLNT